MIERLRDVSRLILRLMLLFTSHERHAIYAGRYTLSAYTGFRAWRMAHIHGRSISVAQVREFLIDALFFWDPNHCRAAAKLEGLIDG